MNIRSHIFIACKEATLLCTQQTERPLTVAEKIKLNIHLLICKPCFYFSKQIVWLQEALKNIKRQPGKKLSEEKMRMMQKKIDERL